MVAQTRTPQSTWIEAGLQALAAGGPDAVRVDLLAKTLGVTRGGFYWHFASRQVFLDALKRAGPLQGTCALKRGVNSMLNGGTEVTLVFGDPPGPAVLFQFYICPFHESL